MNNPLVSIVVPIYNVEKYLYDCLSSIRNQSYKNIEVIMVNDGSKDSSRAIAQKFACEDERFILFDKENGGLSSARNYGLDQAKGEFIAFIDSDDRISKKYVVTLLKSFDNLTDIVIGDYAIYDISTKETFLHGAQYNIGEYSSDDEKKKLVEAMFDGFPVMSVWKNMYRVSFLKKYNLRFVSERLIYAEDMLFHSEAYIVAGKIKIIPNIIFYHMVNPKSLSQGYRNNLFEMNLELHNRITEILRQHYGDKYANRYQDRITNVIGSSMFGMCKCGYKEAVDNMNRILCNEIVKETYRKKHHRKGQLRYWLLYKAGSINSGVVLVIIAKSMQMSKPIYRKIQCRKKYKHLQ